MKRTAFVLAVSILIFACKKSSDIGGNILPIEDLLNAQFTDTATVLTKTIQDEAVRTDKMAVNYLGCINDSRLGVSKASLAVEFYPPTLIPKDSLAPFTLDSIILFIKYSSYYGDTAAAQTLTASILNTPINESNTYLSDASTLTGSTEIGRLDNYKFSPAQKVRIGPDDTVGTPGLIRMPLSASFGNSLLAEIGQNTLTDSAAFKTFFPGLILQTEGTTGNCVVKVDIGDVNFKIALFFRDEDNNKTQMILPASQLSVINGSLGVKYNTVNLYAKDYSGTGIPAGLASAEISDSVTYVLGQSGLLTKVTLPNLMNFGRVAVNKAILEVYRFVPNGNPVLTMPATLYLSRKNASNEYASLLSYGIIAFSSVDSSTFNITGGRYYKYNFNITGYVQDVLFGRESNGDIYINTHLHADKTTSTNPLGAFGYSPAGAVLAGGNMADPNMRAKLKITYSPVK